MYLNNNYNISLLFPVKLGLRNKKQFCHLALLKEKNDFKYT